MTPHTFAISEFQKGNWEAKDHANRAHTQRDSPGGSIGTKCDVYGYLVYTAG